jgi:hypothetical protein
LIRRLGGGSGGAVCDVDERCVDRAIALSDARPSGVRLGLFVGLSMKHLGPSLHSLFGSSQETTTQK